MNPNPTPSANLPVGSATVAPPRPKAPEQIKYEMMALQYREDLKKFNELRAQLLPGETSNPELVSRHQALSRQLNEIKGLQKMLEAMGLFQPRPPQQQPQGGQVPPNVTMNRPPYPPSANPMAGRPMLQARPQMRPPGMMYATGARPMPPMGPQSYPSVPYAPPQRRANPMGGRESSPFAAPVDTTPKPIFTKRKISELIAQIDPRESMDPEVQDILLEIADDFIESVTHFGCMLAKHRKSDTLEVKDIQLHLERNWNIRIPGFGGDEVKPIKKPALVDAHKQRLLLIKKAAQGKDGAKKH